MRIQRSSYRKISEATNRHSIEKGNKVSFKDTEKGNCAKDNSDDEDELKVYTSMARMSNDDVSKNRDYGDSSQLTNWILDSGATCHMTP